MDRKAVLVVDDNRGLHQSLALMTGERFPVRFFTATKLHEALLLFTEHKPILNAILVDGCVEGRTCDTIPFIKMVKDSSFRGPVIAISSDRRNRQLMVENGATMACEKHEIRRTLDGLLFPPEKKRLIARR